jgi:hypothetical protein
MSRCVAERRLNYDIGLFANGVMLAALGACGRSGPALRPAPVRSVSTAVAPATSRADAGTDGTVPIGSDASNDRERDAAPRPVDRHGTPLPAECLDALEVVNYLADQCGDDGPLHCKRLDVARILSRVAPNGIDWSDVNGSAGHLSVAEVRREVQRRSGPGFAWLAHVGFIYWNFGGVWCTSDDTGVSVHLADRYELSFDAAHGLRAIHYQVYERE